MLIKFNGTDEWSNDGETQQGKKIDRMCPTRNETTEQSATETAYSPH